MATGKPIDLLEGRNADPLADWLAAHPGAEVICRDRAGADADGAKTGAPEAIQVADRWPLWHNLGGHVEQAVVRHRGCLTEPGADSAPLQSSPPEAEPPPGPGAPPGDSDGLREVCGRERRLVARTRARYEAVQQLLAGGESLSGICRILSLDRKTVQPAT
jgi:hypothetical protein